MASGDILAILHPTDNDYYPSSDPPVLNRRNNIWVLEFPDDVVTEARFLLHIPNKYGGNGIKVKIFWMQSAAGGATDVRWRTDMAKVTGIDIDDGAEPSWSLSEQTIISTGNATSGIAAEAVTTHLDGSEMDGTGANETAILRVRRDADAGDAVDTSPDTAEVTHIVVTEA